MISNEYFLQYLETISTLEKTIQKEINKYLQPHDRQKNLYLELKKISKDHQNKINEMIKIFK